jgi:hypothetical protein
MPPRPPSASPYAAAPQNATSIATKVRLRELSRSHIHASAAATNGPVAMMMATFDTPVSCKAGINEIIPSVDSDATSQPLFPMLVKSCRPARPCVSTRTPTMTAPPNSPRQNRMVQESSGRSRVKNGAVLQATAAAMAIPCGAAKLSRSLEFRDGRACDFDRTPVSSNREAQARACFSTFALLAGTPNSLRQTSASTATPSRICSCEGLAKHSRRRLPA